MLAFGPSRDWLGRGRQWLAARSARWILVAGWAFAVVLAYPGFLDRDATEQLLEVRSGAFTDLHPPLMTQVWSWCEDVFAGPAPMLVLQLGLVVFGAWGILRRILAPRVAAVVVVAVVVVPPVYAPLGVIWPESMMCGALLAGTAAWLAGWRVAAAGLIVLAIGCRGEAVAAVVPLAILALRPRWPIACVATVGLAIVAIGANHSLATDAHGWAVRYELPEVMSAARGGQLSTAQLGTLPWDPPSFAKRLARSAEFADPDTLQHGPKRLVDPIVDATQAAAVHAAWRESDHVAQRLAFAKHLLGVRGPWQPVYASFGLEGEWLEIHHRAIPSGLEVWMQRFVRAVSRTPLFRPWLYVLLGGLGLGLGWRVIELRYLALSGLALELASIPFATSPAYRSSHWLVATTWLVLVALAVRRRAEWRA